MSCSTPKRSTAATCSRSHRSIALDVDSKWSVDNTDDDVDNTTPYATCPVKRFSDTDPLKVLVRTYSATGEGKERVAQAIEVSRSAKIADESYRRLVRWYSDCQHPRVQLVDSFTVQRPAGDFQILLLRSQSTPVRTFTVGFSHSGNVTSTLVHEIDGAVGPKIETFARTLNDSVSRLCADSGGDCTDQITVDADRAAAYDGGPSLPGHRRSPADRRDRPRMGRRPGILGQGQPGSHRVRCRRLHVDPYRAVQVVRHPASPAASQGVRCRRDDRPIPEREARQGIRQDDRPAGRGLRREEGVGKCRPAELDQDSRLLRQDLAYRPRGLQRQARLLPRRNRAPRPGRRPGDVHAVGRVRRTPEDLRRRRPARRRAAPLHRTVRNPLPPKAEEGSYALDGLEALQDLAHELSGLGRRLADLDARSLERFLLALGGAGSVGHDGAGVAHRLALGRREACDVADDRLRDVLLDVGCGLLLSVATDLADHHDRLGVGVCLECLERVDVRRADDGVTTDADRGREAVVAQLEHHLVRQRARLRDEPDRSRSGDRRRRDACERLARRDDAGAVGADDPGALALGVRPELSAVLDRDALGDDDEETDLSVDRLDDGVLGEGRRHEDD